MTDQLGSEEVTFGEITRGFNLVAKLSGADRPKLIGFRVILVDNVEQAQAVVNRWFEGKKLDPNYKPEKPLFVACTDGDATDLTAAKLLALLHGAESKYWDDLVPTYEERERAKV